MRRSRTAGRAGTRLAAHATRRVLRCASTQPSCCAIPTAGAGSPGSISRIGGRCGSACASPPRSVRRCPSPATTEGFLANDLRPERRTALMLRRAHRCHGPPTPSAATLPPAIETARALLVAPVLLQHELRGWAIVARDTRRKFTRDDLEFLLVLVGQAAAEPRDRAAPGEGGGGRRARGARPDRPRPARRLHPGARGHRSARRGGEAAPPARSRPRAESARGPAHGGGQRIPRGAALPHRAPASEPSGVRPGLDARSSRRRVLDPRAPAASTWRARRPIRACPPSTAYELTQIVREALHNAVRHGQATQAVVKLGARPSHVYLVVRDNGRGFPNGNGPIDARRTFSQPAVAPWSIRERTAALGGSLRVWSAARSRGRDLAPHPRAWRGEVPRIAGGNVCR